MFSPIFHSIADRTASEIFITRVEPEVEPMLPEPYHNLTLRRPVADDEALSPFQIARHYSGTPAPETTIVAIRHPNHRLDTRPAVPTAPVSSIEEAETLVLDLAFQSEAQRYTPPHPNAGSATFCGGGHTPLAILVNRAANIVAAKTRRGAGNSVFIHPDNLTLFSPYGAFVPDANRETIGLWTVAGMLNGAMTVYTRNEFTKDRVVVVFAGNPGDAPAQLINDGGDLTFIAMHGNAADYVRSVIIEK